MDQNMMLIRRNCSAKAFQMFKTFIASAVVSIYLPFYEQTRISSASDNPSGAAASRQALFCSVSKEISLNASLILRTKSVKRSDVHLKIIFSSLCCGSDQPMVDFIRWKISFFVMDGHLLLFEASTFRLFAQILLLNCEVCFENRIREAT